MPEADREAIALDLILKLKEKSKREARRYARQGCYRNGNAPKKSVVQNYEKTREYRRRYTDALERDVIYQEILDDSIRKNYEFREQLDLQVERAERENRKQVRRELAKKLRKLSRAYIHSLDIAAFMNEHRDEVIRREKQMADAYIRSDQMYVEVVKNGGGTDGGYREELCADNWNVFAAQFDSGIFLSDLFDRLADQGICASSALVSRAASACQIAVSRLQRPGWSYSMNSVKGCGFTFMSSLRSATFRNPASSAAYPLCTASRSASYSWCRDMALENAPNSFAIGSSPPTATVASRI